MKPRQRDKDMPEPVLREGTRVMCSWTTGGGGVYRQTKVRLERGPRADLQALRSSTCTRQALGSAHGGVEGRDGIVFQKGASGTGNQMDREKTAQ